MTRPGIESRSDRRLANTLLIRPSYSIVGVWRGSSPAGLILVIGSFSAMWACWTHSIYHVSPVRGPVHNLNSTKVVKCYACLLLILRPPLGGPAEPWAKKSTKHENIYQSKWNVLQYFCLLLARSWRWRTILNCEMPSITVRIFLLCLEHGLGIHVFRSFWASLMIELSSYCTMINCSFTFRTTNGFERFHDVVRTRKAQDPGINYTFICTAFNYTRREAMHNVSAYQLPWQY